MTLVEAKAHPLAFNPRDPEFLDNPYPTYARLRKDDPLHHAATGDLWLTRYADVEAVLADRRFGRATPQYTARSTVLEGQAIPPSMLFQNPPQHTRLRALVARAFTPRTIERLRPVITNIADGLLNRIVAQTTFDLVEDYAFPLPAIVIAEMLGVPPAERHQFHAWTSAVAAAVDSTASTDEQSRGALARAQMAEYFADLVAIRRDQPRDDLISDLIGVHDTGDRLSLGELLSMCALLLAAGHETTVNLIANGVLTLIQHPDQLSLLRKNPALLPGAVEELLRFEAPVQITDRVALEHVNLDGERIEAGERVIVGIGAANRDAAVFDQPDRLDITRNPNPHLSFSHGIHFCLGASLARLEGQLAVWSLLERLSDMELNGPIVRASNPMFRTLRHVPLWGRV
jgi:pimeloyl-[acyl-carrier protein] synthase